MEGLNQKVYDRATKLLLIRLHTVGELHRKLKQKGFLDSDILPVIRRLEELHFLDDRRFAEIFVDNLKRFKDWGYFGIRAKLHARQIPSGAADAVLSEFFTLEDEIAVARKLAGKLERTQKITYEKLARALGSRGFRPEIINKILRRQD